MTKQIWTYIIAVLCIVGGIFLIIKPVESSHNIIYYLGLVLVITGIIKIIGSLLNKNSAFSPESYLFGGIFNTIFGFLLMNNKEGFSKIVPILIGLWLILNATSGLALALNYKRNSNTIDNKIILTNILKLILGIVVLIVPTIMEIFTGWLLGIILLIIGVYIIVNNIKHIKKSDYKVKVK